MLGLFNSLSLSCDVTRHIWVHSTLQNRPSVITCAPASSRNCNMTQCHMNGCPPNPAADQRKANGTHSTKVQSLFLCYFHLVF